MSFISINVAYDVPTWEQTFLVLVAYRRFIESNRDRYVSPTTVTDVRRAKQYGRLAVGFDLEGMNALNEDIDMVAPLPLPTILCERWAGMPHVG